MELLSAGIETGETDEKNIRSDSQLQRNTVCKNVSGQPFGAVNERLGDSVCGQWFLGRKQGTGRERISHGEGVCFDLGWAFARGKGKPAANYEKEQKVFSSCGGAAIYRKSLVEELGYFDEEHFAYLEDTDIGYRALIAGYENWYFPKAKVYHVGSGTSGSRYNQFKIRYSSRNNIYMLYKNMPLLQIVLNLPLLLAGFAIKLLFFALKGYGREYAAGIKNGFSISKKSRKVPFQWRNLGHYWSIQVQLWVNMIRRFL